MIAEKCLIRFEDVYEYAFKGANCGRLEDEDFDAIVNAIESVSAVDAVEVVHGRTGPSYMDEYFGEWKDCLECGTDNIWPSNYCRNCGAKMDGGADDGI